MEREDEMIEQKTRVLTDPEPVFVSLVRVGANMKPLKRLKSASNGFQRAGKSHDYAVFSFHFAKDRFATEDSVRAWLDQGGYRDWNMIETTDSFVVVPIGSEMPQENVQRVFAGDGIVATVGRVSEAREAGSIQAHEPAAVVEKESLRMNDTEPQTVVEETAPVAPPSEPAPDAERATGCTEAQDSAEGTLDSPQAEIAAPVESEVERVAESAEAQVVEKTVDPMGTAASLSEISYYLYWVATDAKSAGDDASTEALRSAIFSLLGVIQKMSQEEVANIEARLASLSVKAAVPLADLVLPPVDLPKSAVEALKAEIAAVKSAVEELSTLLKSSRAAESEIETISKTFGTDALGSENVVAEEKEHPDDKWLRERTIRSLFGSPFSR